MKQFQGELISQKTKETGVRVETICADILLEKTINSKKDFSLWEDLFNQILNNSGGSTPSYNY